MVVFSYGEFSAILKLAFDLLMKIRKLEIGEPGAECGERDCHGYNREAVSLYHWAVVLGLRKCCEPGRLQHSHFCVMPFS